MTRFTGSHRERFTVPVSPAVAALHFGDLDQIIRNYGPIERADVLDPDTIQLTLQEKGFRGVRYQAVYTVRYQRTPGSLRWSTIESQNLWSSGEARFVEAPGGTQIDYQQTIETEVPVPRLLATVAESFVRKEIEAGVQAYLQRMRKARGW